MEKDQLRSYAEMGAKARLEALRSEEREILTTFPALASVPHLTAAPPNGGVTRRRRMSPAARKATSERMKRYWAAQRRK